MRASSDKVQLSFNAGEYSPFLDSRVDIEKASSAARTMRNVLAEVGGTARRRPGLRFVLNTTAGLPDSSSGSSGGEVTNYIEFPFYTESTWAADPVNTFNSYGFRFRGLVRVWSSGTAQIIGEAMFINNATPTTLSEVTFKVATASAPSPAAQTWHTVVTVPTDEQWYPVDWSLKPDPGDSVWFGYGERTSDNPNSRMLLWEYPTGLLFPISAFPGDTAGQISSVIDRVGNDLSVDWEYGAIGNTVGHGAWSWYLDTTDWSLTNFVIHVNQSSSDFPTDTGSFTREIPDSATVGLRLFTGSFPAPLNGQCLSRFDIGPYFRSAYDPVVQQGIDPIP